MKNVINYTSEEEVYLILNLAKATLAHARRVRRYQFLGRRWKIDECRMDDVADFYMEKKSLILQAIDYGFHVGSFELDFCRITNTIINSFINWMIDNHKSKGEKQKRFETKMIGLDEDRIKLELTKQENKMAIHEDIIAANLRFIATLKSDEDRVVWSYITYGGTDEDRRVYLTDCAETIGVGRSQFFVKVKKMKERAQAFLETK
jgi:hypothetical protein